MNGIKHGGVRGDLRIVDQPSLTLPDPVVEFEVPGEHPVDHWLHRQGSDLRGERRLAKSEALGVCRQQVVPQDHGMISLPRAPKHLGLAVDVGGHDEPFAA